MAKMAPKIPIRQRKFFWIGSALKATTTDTAGKTIMEQQNSSFVKRFPDEFLMLAAVSLGRQRWFSKKLSTSKNYSLKLMTGPPTQGKVFLNVMGRQLLMKQSEVVVLIIMCCFQSWETDARPG